jgi:hypothetical protein
LAATRVENGHTDDIAGRRPNRIDDNVIFQNGQTVFTRSGNQSPLNLGSGGITTSMDHSKSGVPTLSRPGQASFSAIKSRPSGPQSRDRLRSLRQNGANGFFVA